LHRRKTWFKSGVFSCIDDIDNQSCATLAQEYDPKGLRTLGVLTKADAIQEGEHASWLKILRGDTHRLKYGYFVTRQSKEDERLAKTSFAEARRIEKAFFNSQEPWASLAGKYRSRFGTEHLTNFLSERLCDDISEK
jgi:hypothetical protein